MRNEYLETAKGQIHNRHLAANSQETQRPLLCLHPSPYSGLFFTTIMPLLNKHRRVLAPDYPGYGGSYALGNEPSIGTYAEALTEAFSSESEYDVLGFHTGCLVGVELAVSQATKVKNLILVDVPYFTGDTQAGLFKKMTKPLALEPDLSCLETTWDFNVTKKMGLVPMERAFDMFLENLRPGTKDYYAFHAAFSYDCEGMFGQVDVPTTVVATRSGLLDATHECAKQINQAELIDEMDITSAVFETGARRIAEIISTRLDN
ncbi:MAG: alpha/beta fold hydrolase [Pseudomonadota bacterium]